MASVLQMEIDMRRWDATKADGAFHSAKYAGEDPWDRLYAIAKTAVCDTLNNGGTFVLVMDQKKRLLTIVQRPDVEP